jgi:HD-GYP domain-containing protein (c-di-GMP phosphodiesterase class II)
MSTPHAVVSASYFSIEIETLALNEASPVDLYINLSKDKGSERYVRVFKQGDSFTAEDASKFKTKFVTTYVSESQRLAYLRALCKRTGRSEAEKVTVLKDSAIHYLENIFSPSKEFSTELLEESLKGCREVVASMVDVIQKKSIDSLQDLIGSLSFHDFYTYDHSVNVSMYCILLYQEARPEATQDEIVSAGLSGLLHDLGKIKVPTDIINKPGKLDDAEFMVIKQHPAFGKELLTQKPVAIPEGVNQETLVRVIYEHHENFDGTGYPNRVLGEDIHLMARICAIADFFDAITTKRSYHKVLAVPEALLLMAKSRGTKLDPKLFDVFMKKAHHFNSKLACTHDLPASFDPCQPGQKLTEVAPHVVSIDGKGDYGKIKVVGATTEQLGAWAKKDNVHVIEPAKKTKKTG